LRLFSIAIFAVVPRPIKGANTKSPSFDQLMMWSLANGSGNIAAFRNASAEVASITNSGGATFSSSVTASGDLTLQGGATRNIKFLDSTNTNLNAQIQYDQITSNSGQLLFGTNNAGTFATRLTIANTGAATFSSSVGINGSPGTNFPLEAYINSSTAHTTSSRGNVFRVYNSNSGANIFAGIELGGAGTANDGLAGINAVVTGSGSAALSFYTRDSNTFLERFRIASTGAATFSSSVTSVGLISSSIVKPRIIYAQNLGTISVKWVIIFGVLLKVETTSPPEMVNPIIMATKSLNLGLMTQQVDHLFLHRQIRL